MTLYLEQISLTNSRVRLALKAGDSKTIIEATNRLCKGNQKKADQLAKWFIEVTESCKQNAKITMDISMMRMWQLGNIDIQEITETGKPIFILTVSGTEKIKDSPKEKLFENLLWEKKKQFEKVAS